MADIRVGLRLGAALDGAFSSVFSNANTVVNRLGATTQNLTKRQQRLGQIMSRALAHPTRDVTKLKRHYDQLGQSLDRLKSKQEKLTQAMARSNTVREQSKALLGEAIGTGAATIGQTVIIQKAVGEAATFADALRDVRINASLTSDDEQIVAKIVRDASATSNRDSVELMGGVGTLMKDGTSVEEINSYTELMGKSMTAFRVNVDTSSTSFIALRDLGVRSGKEMSESLDYLAWAGKQGGLGMDGLFQTIGEFDETIKANNLTLKDMPDIAAMMQIGDGAIGGENAKSALQSMFDQSGRAQREAAYTSSFKDMGLNLDYKTVMSQMMAAGKTQLDAQMTMASGFLDQRAKQKDIKKLMSMEGDTAGQQALMDSLGLSQIFRDMNEVKLVMAYKNNQDEFKRIKQGGGAEQTGSLNKTYDTRMESPTEKFKQFGLSVKELSVTFGETLLPPIITITEKLTVTMGVISHWVAMNPMLVKGLVGVMAGLTALKIGLLALKVGKLFLISQPLSFLKTSLARASAGLELFRAEMLLTGSTSGSLTSVFPKIGGAIASVGRVMSIVGKTMLASPVGLVITGIATAAFLIYKYWDPIAAFFGGVFDGISEALRPLSETFNALKDAFAPISVALSPVVDLFAELWNWVTQLFAPFEATQEQLAGATSAGKSFGLIVGKVLEFLLTPLKYLPVVINAVGDVFKTVFSWSPMQTITGIWDSVTTFFGDFWKTITTAFDGGITGIGTLILNWSPLGLFYKAFESALNWFGVELPADFTGFISSIFTNVADVITNWSPIENFKSSFQSVIDYFTGLPSAFTDFGKNILDGLLGGITSKIETVKNTVTELGSSISSWFKDILGINSPSRVFIGFGENISEGAAIGISSKKEDVEKSVDELSEITASAQLNVPSIASSHSNSPQASNSASESIQISYSPIFNITGVAEDIKRQVESLVKQSAAEFERLLKQNEHKFNRRAYTGIDR